MPIIEKFITHFINIVGVPPQCSRSMRLIIVDVLTVNGVTKLKNMLIARHEFMTLDTSNEVRARTNNVLHWIQGVQP